MLHGVLHFRSSKNYWAGEIQEKTCTKKQKKSKKRQDLEFLDEKWLHLTHIFGFHFQKCYDTSKRKYESVYEKEWTAQIRIQITTGPSRVIKIIRIANFLKISCLCFFFFPFVNHNLHYFRGYGLQESNSTHVHSSMQRRPTALHSTPLAFSSHFAFVLLVKSAQMDICKRIFETSNFALQFSLNFEIKLDVW